MQGHGGRGMCCCSCGVCGKGAAQVALRWGDAELFLSRRILGRFLATCSDMVLGVAASQNVALRLHGARAGGLVQ
jgi:hypothetical protein